MDFEAPAIPKKGEPGALIFTLALIVAVLWIVGALAAAVVLVGPARINHLTLPEMGAIAAAAFLPALMACFSGLAARDSARARSEARRLADAADRLMNPERSAEGAARQLAMTVRSEITTLDHALEATLSRLQDVQNEIARQKATVENMADQAKAGANTMITGMEREREELMKISRDLTGQAQTIGESISRHTSSISQAAQRAEAEVRAADQALDHRLTSFGAAAALITDRTQHLTGAAQASADSALRLETALSNALDILAKATHLTDAARDSAEAASVAANSTAGAVRESTVRAIEDAKRAADLIRGESATVEQEAAIALERLREAAEAARIAAIGARQAVEETTPEPAPRQRSRSAPRQPEPRYDNSWRDQQDPLEQPRARGGGGRTDYGRGGADFGERDDGVQGEWTWRDLLSSVDENGSAAPSRREPAEDPVAHLRRQISEPRNAPSPPIIGIIEQGGLSIDDVFSPSGLERIAQRARSGSQARRRAVRDAAPEATRRFSDYLARNARANQEAMQFLRNEGARMAELLGRGRAPMNSELTRAFLLIDAAAS